MYIQFTEAFYTRNWRVFFHVNHSHAKLGLIKFCYRLACLRPELQRWCGSSRHTSVALLARIPRQIPRRESLLLQPQLISHSDPLESEYAGDCLCSCNTRYHRFHTQSQVGRQLTDEDTEFKPVAAEACSDDTVRALWVSPNDVLVSASDHLVQVV